MLYRYVGWTDEEYQEDEDAAIMVMSLISYKTEETNVDY